MKSKNNVIIRNRKAFIKQNKSKAWIKCDVNPLCQRNSGPKFIAHYISSGSFHKKQRHKRNAESEKDVEGVPLTSYRFGVYHTKYCKNSRPRNLAQLSKAKISYIFFQR